MKPSTDAATDAMGGRRTTAASPTASPMRPPMRPMRQIASPVVLARRADAVSDAVKGRFEGDTRAMRRTYKCT